MSVYNKLKVIKYKIDIIYYIFFYIIYQIMLLDYIFKLYF